MKTYHILADIKSGGTETTHHWTVEASNAKEARQLFDEEWPNVYPRNHAFHIVVVVDGGKKHKKLTYYRQDGFHRVFGETFPRWVRTPISELPPEHHISPKLDAELVAVANSTLAQAAGYSLDEARKMLGEKFLPPKGWKGGNA